MILPRVVLPSFLVALALMIVIAAHPAKAGCFEDVGCTDRDYFSEHSLSRLGCQNLDFLRNTIYAENGYCFRKHIYREIFGDENCRFDSSGDVPLNRIERMNISAIVSVERWKGCRR